MTSAIPKVLFSNGHLASVTTTYTESVSASLASPVTCSYQGGCPLTIEGTNIGLDSELVIHFQGYECVRPTTAVKDSITCIMPAFPSKYSLTSYTDFMEAQKWNESPHVEIVASPNSFAKHAFDDIPSTTSEGEPGCYIGLKVINSHVGTIESVRFLFSNTEDENHYVDGKFEASANGNTWATLYTITEPPIAGWNTMDT